MGVSNGTSTEEGDSNFFILQLISSQVKSTLDGRSSQLEKDTAASYPQSDSVTRKKCNAMNRWCDEVCKRHQQTTASHSRSLRNAF
jgi:hypothetical protein